MAARVIEPEIPAVETPFDDVTVDVPLDYQGNEKMMYLNVNDHNFRIPRGRRVVLPRFAAEVLQRSLLQDLKARELIEKTSRDDNYFRF